MSYTLSASRARPALFAALLALLATQAARAQEPIFWNGHDRLSLGLTLGGPTGLNLEKNLPSGNAFDVGLGVVYAPGLRLYADYLWTVARSRNDSDLFIRFQIGVGGMVGSLTHPCEFYGNFGTCNGNIYVGVRVPFAIEFWPRAPLNFGLAIAPVIAFGPDGAGGFLDGYLFVRFVL